MKKTQDDGKGSYAFGLAKVVLRYGRISEIESLRKISVKL